MRTDVLPAHALRSAANVNDLLMDLLQQRIAVDQEIVRRGSFYDFARMAWPLIDPAPLVLNWHLEEKCTHLEAVSRGEIKKLVINEPPGSGKSNFVNVLWNVWEWIKRPQTKFLYASFDASLVGTRDGGKVIKLLESDWFKARWGVLLPTGKKAASHFETVAGGLRFSTSPSGKGTGRHGDIRVIDDPLKPKDASGGATMTKNALRFVSGWIADTWCSRATDQTTVRDVLIMQRLHEEDPAGEALAKGDCVHLCLPMLFDPDNACTTQWGGDRRTKKDELLFPQRFPQWKITQMREIEMGEEVFAAQCQQRPQRKGGSTFKREWWRFWHYNDTTPEPCLCDKCWMLKRTLPGHEQTRMCQPLSPTGFEFQSWDCTFKDVETSDFVCGGVIRASLPYVFLLECQNERLSITNTMQAIRSMSARFPKTHDKLIEDKANGAAVQDLLKAEIPGITLVNPEGGKESRANAGSIYFSSGRFFLPHPSLVPWVWPYMAQHEGFPRAANDDMVDMTSQGLVRLRQFGEHFSAAMRKIRGEK